MPESSQNHLDLKLITELAIKAGQIGLGWFGKDPQVWMKEGQSPVSEADFAIDQFLKKELIEARPDYGWLSEETEDSSQRLSAKRTFVVDPIDGTRGFINGKKQWCVSIAVVENNRPVAGVLECPALDQTITASVNGQAHCNGTKIAARMLSRTEGIKVTGPRSFQAVADNEWSRQVEKIPFVPSLAYRLAMIAMGEIDLSLARASAKDWDLAAADLIVHEAGARLTDMQSNNLTYNCRDIRHGTLIASASAHHDEMLDLARQAIDNPQDR